MPESPLPPSTISEPASSQGIAWKPVALRIAFLAVMAVALYLFLPGLLELFGSFDRLRDINPLWFVAMIVAVVASYGLVSVLTKLLLPTASMFGITCAQLVGHVMSTIIPGGAATGGAVQYKMLVTAGAQPAAVGSAMTVQGILLTSAVFTLPAFVLPTILLGAPAPSGLVQTALVGFVIFIVLIAVGFVLMISDRAVAITARFLGWLQRRFRPHAPGGSEGLYERLLHQRNEVRANLGRSWQKAVVYSIGKWALEYVALVLALAAVGARPRPSLVLLAYTASAVLSMVPITPGGLGFVEAGLAATLALAGVEPGAATVATLAYRLVTYWLPLPVGGILYLVFRRHYQGRGLADGGVSPPVPA